MPPARRVTLSAVHARRRHRVAQDVATRFGRLRPWFTANCAGTNHARQPDRRCLLRCVVVRLRDAEWHNGAGDGLLCPRVLPAMTTLLDKTLRRELLISERPFILAISPQGLKLTLKGRRKGLELKK